jgi:hypothetical protein
MQPDPETLLPQWLVRQLGPEEPDQVHSPGQARNCCLNIANHAGMSKKKTMPKRKRVRAGYIEQLVRTTQHTAVLMSCNNSVLAFEATDEPVKPHQLKYICALRKMTNPDVFNRVNRFNRFNRFNNQAATPASAESLRVEIVVQHMLCGWCACDLREVRSIKTCRVVGE